ncbi:MAG: hypothetical protein WAL50_09820 [Kineosporiaceae bacterium]|jgi:hypothetical protein
MAEVPIATVGERFPADPTERRRAVHLFGPARALHLGDFLGPVRGLRALAADPGVDLTVVIGGEAAEAAQLAAALVACGLGSVSFEREGAPVTPEDLAEVDAWPMIYDLREPRVPMGSSPGEGRGVVRLLDGPLLVAAAIRKAQTDLDPLLGYDPQLRPGVANLATILGALTDRTPIAALYGLHGASQLKRAVTEILIETLRPVRELYRDLAGDPETLHRLVRPAPLEDHQ